MPISQGVTLTATTTTILGNAALLGFLRITLCGFGPVLPCVPGATSMLADAGEPDFIGPLSTFSVKLWGNDVITPANTFYEIAVLDSQKNVVQAGMYQFLNAVGTVDLSTLSQFVGPYGTLPNNLVYEPCSGAVPGYTYVSPGPIVILAYNGVLLPEGLALPVLSYTVAGDQKTVTLNFTTGAGDRIDALCIL